MKAGKKYVTRAGRKWALSRTRLVYRCAAEAGVCERIAREVLFHDGPVTSNARERAYRWGIANRVIQPRREREQVDEIEKARTDAEERDGALRVADATTEATRAPDFEDPSVVFDRIVAKIAAAEREMKDAEKNLSSDVAREQIEARARELEGRKP